MTEYKSRPNSGAFFRNTKKDEGSKHPDFKGDITLSPELVKELADAVNSRREPKISLAGWSKESKAGVKYISLAVSGEWKGSGKSRSSDDPPF